MTKFTTFLSCTKQECNKIQKKQRVDNKNNKIMIKVCENTTITL